jgi:hypothetical protein
MSKSEVAGFRLELSLLSLPVCDGMSTTSQCEEETMQRLSDVEIREISGGGTLGAAIGGATAGVIAALVTKHPVATVAAAAAGAAAGSWVEDQVDQAANNIGSGDDRSGDEDGTS